MFNIPDSQTEYQINILFNRHDRNGNGYLSVHELEHFFNDLFQCMGYPHRITRHQAKELMYEMDSNCDGRCNRMELLRAFKYMMNNGSRYGFSGCGNQGGWGNNEGYGNQGFGNQGFGNQGFGNQGFGNQGFGNQGMGGQGWGNTGFGNQGFGNQGMGGQGFGNQGMGGQGFGNQGMGGQGWGNTVFGNQGMGYNGYPNQGNSMGWGVDRDQLLRSKIDLTFLKYDRDCSGTLNPMEFNNAIRDLCMEMGICPPQNYETVRQLGLQADRNFSGQVTKIELFSLFKRMQGY